MTNFYLQTHWGMAHTHWGYQITVSETVARASLPCDEDVVVMNDTVLSRDRVVSQAISRRLSSIWLSTCALNPVSQNGIKS
jgi:hypothetical protein